MHSLKVEPEIMAQRSIADSQTKREAREKRVAERFEKGSPQHKFKVKQLTLASHGTAFRIMKSYEVRELNL